MKSYIFRVELEPDEDGRWSAVVPALSGCAVWGHTVEEALEAIQDAAQTYVQILIEDGRPIPLEAVDSGGEGAAVAVVA
jgi:predicted RNase H-like HicB family nuclease